MGKSRFFRALLVAVSLPLTLVYWPTACAGGSGAGQASQPATETPFGPEAPQAPQPFQGVLPHPAFAFAGPDATAASVADIAERTTSSVVSIVSKRQAGPMRHPLAPFFGPQRPREQQGLGSGVIVSADGVVLTNHHVVEGATEIKVTTADDREYDAEVVGSDDKSDLAVLRLKGELSNLSPLSFGDSSNLRLGDIVLAIGNPFGVGQTVTMGIVSAKGRADVGIVDYEDFIQTDAAINPGNSGGALVNMRGELVGINTAILSRSGGYQGIGFAIPANMARPIMSSLLAHGKVVRGFLGIGIQDVDADLQAALELDSSQGVLVTEVQSGSAAEKGGLQRGDVVVSVDGVAVDTTGKLRNLIASKGADKDVSLKVRRGRKTTTLKVKLGELPGSEQPVAAEERGTKGGVGVTLAPLDARHKQLLRLPEDTPGKVVITAVARDSRASRAGLAVGDVVLEINRKPVNDVAAAVSALSREKGTVVLAIRRGGANRYVVVKP